MVATVMPDPPDHDPAGVTVGLNHAVLYVTDPDRSADFYERMLGLERQASVPIGHFLGSPRSSADHDLGLFRSRGETGGAGGSGQPGLYHLAWEVETLADLAAVAERLQDEGALVGATDHAVTKSLYAHDPDGIEFEVMWQVPLDALAERDAPDAEPAQLLPLDLDAEIERYGAQRRGGHLAARASSG